MNRCMIKDTYRRFLPWKVCDKHAVTVDCIRPVRVDKLPPGHGQAAVWAFVSGLLLNTDVFVSDFYTCFLLYCHNLFLYQNILKSIYRHSTQILPGQGRPSSTILGIGKLETLGYPTVNTTPLRSVVLTQCQSVRQTNRQICIYRGIYSATALVELCCKKQKMSEDCIKSVMKNTPVEFSPFPVFIGRKLRPPFMGIEPLILDDRKRGASTVRQARSSKKFYLQKCGPVVYVVDACDGPVAVE